MSSDMGIKVNQFSIMAKVNDQKKKEHFGDETMHLKLKQRKI